MHALAYVPTTGTALFHSRYGGFPLLLCSYVLLDADGNNTADLDAIVVVCVTAINGERFRLRDPDDIQGFLAAVERFVTEVAQ